MGKQGGEVSMGNMGTKHKPHGSSGDVAGHSCLPLRDAMQGDIKAVRITHGLEVSSEGQQ